MSNLERFQISIISVIIIGLCAGTIFAEEETATLTVMIGTVEFCPSGTDTWEEATEGMKLSAGDKVRTGIDGMLSIRFTNGSLVTLKQDTQFAIQSLNLAANKKDIDCRLQLTRGKLRALVEELGDGSFEIVTPTAVAAVRGTTFYLDVREVSEDELPPDVKERLMTELFVVEGGVIYTNTLSGKFYIVTADETASSYSTGTITEPIEIPPDKQQEWIEGWDDILAAEPYQEAGADPDLTNGEGGEPGGEERQSNQMTVKQVLEEIYERDENDIVQEEIVAKLLERDELLEEKFLRDQIRKFLKIHIAEILDENRSRRRDAYLEKISDAQRGKVLRDIQGRRVRVEQYVLRPAEEGNVVELLNVNLRDGDLTTMEWVTTFNQSLDNLPTGTLKDLPWNSYLDTHSFFGIPYISSPYQPDSIYPEAMSVKFTHKNDLCDDAFSESRKFHDRKWLLGYYQRIYDRELWVKNFNDDQSMDYRRAGWFSGQRSGTYSISSGKRNAEIGEKYNNPKGFQYRFKSTKGLYMTMEAAFYVVDEDGIIRQNYRYVRINDVWDALRVNMGSRSKNIGNNNLEMIFSSVVFGGQPIDLIYIPMLSMDWQADDYIPFPKEENEGPPFLMEVAD